MGICDRRSLAVSARWLPKGFHTITPNIIVDDAEQAVAFLKNAFRASEEEVAPAEMQRRMKAEGY